ncbi:MAG: hypothetical protein SGARI_003628, partial [Bacillariaceae sp.]
MNQQMIPPQIQSAIDSLSQRLNELEDASAKLQLRCEDLEDENEQLKGRVDHLEEASFKDYERSLERGNSHGENGGVGKENAVNVSSEEWSLRRNGDDANGNAAATVTMQEHEKEAARILFSQQLSRSTPAIDQNDLAQQVLPPQPRDALFTTGFADGDEQDQKRAPRESS